MNSCGTNTIWVNLQWVLLILHFKQSLIKRGAHYVRLTQNFPYLLIKILSIREALCTRHCSGLGRVIVMTQYELSHGLISPCSLGGLHLYLQSSEILLMSDLRGLSRYQSGRRRRMSPKRKYSCVDTVGKRHFLITERSDYLWTTTRAKIHHAEVALSKMTDSCELYGRCSFL